MLTMSLDRAKLIDKYLFMAKENYETKGYASMKYETSNNIMEVAEFVEIGNILKAKGYGYITADSYLTITPSGMDFLECGGFTKLIQEEIDDERDKERDRKRAKREPLFRWISIILAFTQLLQFLFKFFNLSI